jgi:hypothetical protein
MQSTVLKRFESPDETRTFEKGRFVMGAERYAHGATGD